VAERPSGPRDTAPRGGRVRGDARRVKSPARRTDPARMAERYVRAPIPAWEGERLGELRSLRLLDTAREERFDRLTALAADVFSAPIALVTLIDAQRQWFKSAWGLDAPETSRDPSLCAHALLEDEILVVPDTHDDPRFADNPLVRNAPHIRFYAGAVLRGPGGLPVGTLCVIDPEPREISDADARRLLHLARIAQDEIRRDVESTQLREQALRDPVTSLPTPQLFRELMRERLPAQLEKQGACVARVELPGIALLQRALGDALTEELAVHAAERLSAVAGADGVAARLGSSEFALLAPLEERGAVEEIRDGLLDLALDPVRLSNGVEMPVALRAGLAVAPEDGRDPEDLLGKSCIALLRSAAAGASAIERFDVERDRNLLRRSELARRLHASVHEGALELHYQPQVDIASGRLAGVEALMRWNDARFGPVPPSDFIPLAESTGLIEPLGAWAIAQACRQSAAWRRGAGVAVKVAVNVAGPQIGRGLARSVEEALAASGTPAELLELEITESSLVRDAPGTLEELRRLRELGVRISVDDFGTGYSCLAYLNRLPVSALKIDRGFVDRLAVAADAAKIVQATIALAHALDLVVVAEGVERDDQLALLRDYGCDRAQGFLFSPAVAADAIPALACAGWRAGPVPGWEAP